MPQNAKTTSALAIVDRLRRDISEGVFAPGARLVTADLGKRYGTSAMPIRSALQVLQVEGFVVYSPHQGASVRPLDADYVRQLYDMRVALSVMLLGHVVRHISLAHIETIEELLTEYGDKIRAGDTVAAMHTNARFHRAIYSVAGNAPALEALERSWMILDALRTRVGFGPGRLTQSDEGHHKLLDALQRRDLKEAVRVATHYAELACADLVERISAAEN